MFPSASDLLLAERSHTMRTPGGRGHRTGNLDADLSSELDLLRECLRERALGTVFQPIMELRSGRVYGYEALTRGPKGSALEFPDRLFGVARRFGLGPSLERVAARLALERFAGSGVQGKLFVNFSPAALESQALSGEEIVYDLRSLGLSPSQVVIELTEQESIGDRKPAWETLLNCRKLGFEIAIDDLGEGFASLKLWSELRPEYVKVDKHFINGCSRDPLKLQMTRAIQLIAQISGSKVLAEGIEESGDFMAVRDLGLRFGQGYLFSHPGPRPESEEAVRVWQQMSGKPIPAFPEPTGPVGRVTARKLLRTVVPVAPEDVNDHVFARFEAEPDLHVLPVVSVGVPMGVINRAALIDRFARPYRRELFGKRSCSMFMNARTVSVDINTALQEISLLISEAGPHALADGFVITEEGRYLGIGSGQDLMREITEQQITAARYANPLTLLPGNVPIAQHIERLITQGCSFVACYCDLDNFKPYNDVYGYQRGDEALLLTAKVLTESCEPRFDFLGHVGGDDFVLVFQSADWERRCEDALLRFQAGVRQLYSAEDVVHNGFHAEDRAGTRQFFPLTSLSIGAVQVVPGTYASHYEVAAAATDVKKQAKRIDGNALFVERRTYPPASIRPPAADA